MSEIASSLDIKPSFLHYLLPPHFASFTQSRSYLEKLHIAEDMYRVVWRVDVVVAAAVELGAAAPIVITLSDRGFRAIQATASGR